MDKNTNKEETSLEQIEPELEETESYKKASFGEKISLKLRKKLIANRLSTILLVAVLIAIIWGINLWADSKNLAQIDVTENHLYSLTNTSKDQLKSLDKDVMVYLYGFTKDSDLYQFIQQYNAFNKKISYEIITESTNYEAVTKYGLGTYSALVIVCGDKDRTIYPDYEFSSYDYDTGESIDITEETITNAILKVSSDDPVKVYFATGNGEYGTNDLQTLSTYLEEEVYETEDLNLMTITEIPEDCDILAIMSPEEDLTDTQAELIKTYVNNGGNLLVCALVPSSSDFTNLQSILALYGAKIEKGLLYEGDSRYYLAYQNSSPLPYVLIPEFSNESLISSSLSTSNNQMAIMPWSQAVTITDVEDENVQVTSGSIVYTSQNCYNITDYSNGITSSVLNNLDKSTYVIGSELTRTVNNGEEEKESKLVVYGNGTFFFDSYRDGNVQISTMSNPGNINLIMNTFAELGDEENLITVRKSTNVKDFKKTEADDRIVKLIIFGIPVLIILFGIVVWNRRKSKR